MFVIGLIVLTSAISIVAFQQRSQMERMLFHVGRILGKREYYRLISSAFVHGDWMHLLFNMYSLYLFSDLLEKVYGPTTVAMIYFVSVLGGSLLSLFVHRYEAEYRAVGASGGVCGVIFASVFLTPGNSIGLIFIPIFIPDYVFACIFIGITVWGMRSKNSRIGHDAHLGGALTAMLAVLIFYPRAAVSRIELFIGLFALTGILYFYVLRGQHVNWRKLFRARASSNPLPFKRPSSSRKKQQLNPDKMSSRAKQRRVDELLDQVSEKGIHTLTQEERNLLDSHAEKLKQRKG
ncbi:MAG: rhomboid family intramembrane serine protease [Verrucomicrobiota bacterium]